MSAWRVDLEEALDAFVEVARLADDPIGRSDMVVEFLPAPHRAPARLPPGKQAIYAFWFDGRWLKIGKVGPKSGARYTSQHYARGRALSTLAGSLAADSKMCADYGIDRADPGAWIKDRTHRVNILLPGSRTPSLLALLEAFLHARLHPLYEHRRDEERRRRAAVP